jgi:hypothetical protein
MSNDDFEDSSGSSSADVETYKYAQLTVPNFEFDASSVDEVDTDDKYSGSSFVRLGSFPDFTLATTSVTVDGVATTKRTVSSVATDAPTGFTNSLELAKLVGDADRIASAEGSDTASGSSGLLRSSHYAGDSNYLLGFADDTRSRVDDAENATTEKIIVDGKEATNTQANRKTETKRLLTKGGWWDHSDGNRVSTTSGDKLEVIQGNYKMVILGRQDPTKTVGEIVGNAFITDISGGHLQEQGPSPTPCIKSVEWVKTEDGWTLFQDNGSGNVTTTFHGKQVDYYTGARKESYIGKEPSTVIDGDTQGEVDLAILKSQSKTPSEEDDPVLISKTWAKRIETYTGSEGKPTPVVYSLTHAESINSFTFATEILSFVMALGNISINVGLATEINLMAKYSYLLKEIHVASSSNVVTAEQEELTAMKVSASAVAERLIVSKNEIVAADTEFVDVKTGVTTNNTLLSTINTKVSMEVDTIITQAAVVLSAETLLM